MKLLFDEYVIRDWQDEDLSALVKYANNKKIALNLRDGFPHPYTRADAKTFIARAKRSNPKTMFAIASSDEAIGSIGLLLGTDVHRFTAEFGYWLAEPFWSKGIMTKAISVFTEFAFKTFNLNRLYAEPYANNHASARVLEKAGFIREAVLRANVVKEEKILDQFLYAQVRIPQEK